MMQLLMMVNFQAGCVWLPFELLISSSMVLGNVTLLLVFGGYVILKRNHPEGTEWGQWLV